MKKNIIKTCVLLAIAVALIFLVYAKVAGKMNTANREKTDALAKCLADKKITMYGSRLCPHCTNQKELFGASFQYVPYIECLDEPDKCAKAGITGYPTWVLPDGKQLVGEQSLESLAQEGKCVFK